jgi:hypothetical protein
VALPLVIKRVVTVPPAVVPASRPTLYAVVFVHWTAKVAVASVFAANTPCVPKFSVLVETTWQFAWMVIVELNEPVAVVEALALGIMSAAGTKAISRVIETVFRIFMAPTVCFSNSWAEAIGQMRTFS